MKHSSGNRIRRAAARLCLGALCLGLAACRGEAAPDPPPAAGVSRAEEPAPRFALVTKESNNSYMHKMYEGFAAACGEMGVEADLYGPDDYSAAAQIEIIDRLVAEEVDVIAVAANDPDDLEESLAKALAAGIVVISLDSSVNPDSRLVHIEQVDPEKVGRALIQAAGVMVGGKGTAAIISSTPYATNQNLWLEWMKREYAENPEKYSDFVLLEERYGEDSAEITRRVVMELLEEEPGPDIIITPSVVSMQAVGELLAERESDMLFTGLGLPSEIAAYIQDGSCPWMYLWNPIDLGYLAAYASGAILRGEIRPAELDSFQAGRLGVRSVTLSADGGLEVLLGDPVKFDSENIDQWKSVY